MSFGNPRSIDSSTAPRMPIGTTSSTDTGTDQLSYSAARHRNTTTIDSTISSVVCPADSSSWCDCPAQS